MPNTLASREPDVETRPQISVSRTYGPKEFDADTDEERTVVLLAERRRVFLTGLNAKQPFTGTALKA